MSEEIASIRIVRPRMVYGNQFGTLYDDDVEFCPAGVAGRYVRWQWRAPYSVAVLAMGDPSSALLIRNFRHSARREVLEVVKGFGDAERSPAEVARAELSEELGFTAHELKFLGVTVADAAFAYQPMHCFLAEGIRDQVPRPEESEAISGARAFDLAETPEALGHGTVEDAVTLSLLWHAYSRWIRTSDEP